MLTAPPGSKEASIALLKQIVSLSVATNMATTGRISTSVSTFLRRNSTTGGRDGPTKLGVFGKTMSALVGKPSRPMRSSMRKVVAQMLSDADAEKEQAAQSRCLQCAILVPLPLVMGGYIFSYSLANERSSCGAPPATVTLSAALVALICVLPVFSFKHGLHAVRPIFQRKNVVRLVPASLTCLGRVLTFQGVKEVNPTLVMVVMQSNLLWVVVLRAAAMRTRIKFTSALGAFLVVGMTLWFTLMSNSDEEDGGVSWAGLLLVLAGTFLADVGALALEFVARDDAQDSATIGRTVLMQDIGKIPLMGLLCGFEMGGILSHGVEECFGFRFFLVVLSLFLHAVLSNASTVICGYVLTATVSTLSVAAVYLLEVCFLEAKPDFTECVALATLVVGIAYMNYMEDEVEQAAHNAKVAALTDVVGRLDQKEVASQKKDKDDEVAKSSQVGKVPCACSVHGFETFDHRVGESRRGCRMLRCIVYVLIGI